MPSRLHLASGLDALPGLALVATVAAAAWALHLIVPAVSAILFAIVIGIGVASAVRLPGCFDDGISFSAQRLLRIGIVLLGARLSLGAIMEIGGPIAVLVVGLVGTILALGWFLGHCMGLPPTLIVLITVGTAICGNSAIIAIAPLIRAGARDVSLAVATITLFGTFALVAYPLIGRALGLDDAGFGAWVGLAVNDTSQVVGAGAAYSPEARDVATVVKLIRNVMIAPVVVAAALLAAWREPTGARTGLQAGIVRALPLFVLGFLGMAVLRSVGIIGETMADRLADVATVCVLFALAAVGLGSRIGELRSAGSRPVFLGLGLGATLAILAGAAVMAFGVGG